MKRWDIIQGLINKNDYKSYLEIGVSSSQNFDRLRVTVKDSVDPNGHATFNMTSDEFFAMRYGRKYDIVFVDGLHLHEQVIRDIENSLDILSENGIIVVHDCMPQERYEQERTPRNGRPWTGDVWKAFAKLRMTRDDLEMCVVATDCGCGIVRPGSQEVYIPASPLEEVFTWEYYRRHAPEMLNVIVPAQFKDKYL
jgi:hypothetical protein